MSWSAPVNALRCEILGAPAYVYNANHQPTISVSANMTFSSSSPPDVASDAMQETLRDPINVMPITHILQVCTIDQNVM